jgi:hypothetical protein
VCVRVRVFLHDHQRSESVLQSKTQTFVYLQSPAVHTCMRWSTQRKANSGAVLSDRGWGFLLPLTTFPRCLESFQEYPQHGLAEAIILLSEAGSACQCLTLAGRNRSILSSSDPVLSLRFHFLTRTTPLAYFLVRSAFSTSSSPQTMHFGPEGTDAATLMKKHSAQRTASHTHGPVHFTMLHTLPNCKGSSQQGHILSSC